METKGITEAVTAYMKAVNSEPGYEVVRRCRLDLEGGQCLIIKTPGGGWALVTVRDGKPHGLVYRLWSDAVQEYKSLLHHEAGNLYYDKASYLGVRAVNPDEHTDRLDALREELKREKAASITKPLA